MLDLPVALAYVRQSPKSYAVAAQLPERRRARGGVAEGVGQPRSGRLGDARVQRRRHDRTPRAQMAAHRTAGRRGRTGAGAEDRECARPSRRTRALAEIVEISSPKGAPWEFLVIFATLLLGPVVLTRARARDRRPAAGRLRDRSARPRPDRLGQQHAPRPRPARPAVSDVRRRCRARPEPAASLPALGDRVRAAHVRVPDGRRDRRSGSRSGGKPPPRSCSARCWPRTR